MKNLEPLATYPTRMAAEGIKGLLENNGITCFLQFDETGDVMEGVGVDDGPTVIYVPKEYLEQARELANVKNNSGGDEEVEK
jgi:hypothetical protein